MKTITIKVTQTDIDVGEPGEGEYCPIALAVKRISGVQFCLVGPENLYINDDRQEVKLPKKAVEFISGFDKNRSGIPFNFTLKIP